METNAALSQAICVPDHNIFISVSKENMANSDLHSHGHGRYYIQSVVSAPGIVYGHSTVSFIMQTQTANKKLNAASTNKERHQSKISLMQNSCIIIISLAEKNVSGAQRFEYLFPPY